jgi:hypothetical protein
MCAAAVDILLISLLWVGLLMHETMHFILFYLICCGACNETFAMCVRGSNIGSELMTAGAGGAEMKSKVCWCGYLYVWSCACV